MAPDSVSGGGSHHDSDSHALWEEEEKMVSSDQNWGWDRSPIRVHSGRLSKLLHGPGLCIEERGSRSTGLA